MECAGFCDGKRGFVIEPIQEGKPKHFLSKTVIQNFITHPILVSFIYLNYGTVWGILAGIFTFLARQS